MMTAAQTGQHVAMELDFGQAAAGVATPGEARLAAPMVECNRHYITSKKSPCFCAVNVLNLWCRYWSA